MLHSVRPWPRRFVTAAPPVPAALIPAGLVLRLLLEEALLWRELAAYNAHMQQTRHGLVPDAWSAARR